MGGIAFLNGQIVFKTAGEVGFGTACCCNDCAVGNANIQAITTLTATINSYTLSGTACAACNTPDNWHTLTSQPDATGSYTGSASFGTVAVETTCPQTATKSAGCFNHFSISATPLSIPSVGVISHDIYTASSCSSVEATNSGDMNQFSYQISMFYDDSTGNYVCSLSQFFIGSSVGGNYFFEIAGSKCATAATQNGPFNFSGSTEPNANDNCGLFTASSFSLDFEFA